jgi:hypothetical protein
MTNTLRLPERSAIQPAQYCSDEADKSARPSMSPNNAADAPAMVVKKIAKTEKIISELRSVKKLTTPNLMMSG